MPVVDTHIKTVSGLVDVYQNLAKSNQDQLAYLRQMLEEQRKANDLLVQLTKDAPHQ